MWKIVLDSFLDTLKVFPFLLVIYVLIEFLEHRTTFISNRKILQGKLAPLLGAATGLIPQCGFSVMAAKLYDKGLIRTGTLLSVLIASSDEALIILLSSGSSAAVVMPLVLIKLVVGIGIGCLVNFLYSAEKLCETDEDIDAYSCGRTHEGEKAIKMYVVNPLLHALLIAFYLLIVNLIFGFVIYQVGEDKIAQAMIGGVYFQPFITAVIGLIPNCASSAVITGTYIHGGITFGSLVAGLCANAGFALVILFKNTKKIKRNIVFVLILYLISVIVGVLLNIILSALIIF